MGAVDFEQLPVRGHQLQPGDRRREVSEGVARPVGAGRDRTGNRDVREGSHVVQGVSLRVQPTGEHPVPGAGGDRDGHPLGIETRLRGTIDQ